MSVARPVLLRVSNEPPLAAMTRSQTVRAAAQRAHTVLLAADAAPNAAIARRVRGSSRPVPATSTTCSRRRQQRSLQPTYSPSTP
jgi:hypothetical protein